MEINKDEKMSSRRAPMPQLDAIARYWFTDLALLAKIFPDNKALIIGSGEPFCFRCGWLAPVPELYVCTRWNTVGGWLEKAHLHDHAGGGSEQCDNLVPLCVLCHRMMPETNSRDEGIAFVNTGKPCDDVWQLVTDGAWGEDHFQRYVGVAKSRIVQTAFMRFQEMVRS